MIYHNTYTHIFFMTRTILEKANECLMEVSEQLTVLQTNFNRERISRLTYTESASLLFLEMLGENHPEIEADIFLLTNPQSINSSEWQNNFIVIISKSELSENALTAQDLCTSTDLAVYIPLLNQSNRIYTQDMLLKRLSPSMIAVRAACDPSLRIPSDLSMISGSVHDISFLERLRQKSPLATPSSASSLPSVQFFKQKTENNEERAPTEIPAFRD